MHYVCVPGKSNDVSGACATRPPRDGISSAPMSHRAAAALALLLALAPAASAQVLPAEVEEGRPVTLRVGWTNKGQEAVLLRSLRASVGAERASLEGERHLDA